jgi:hypothetical protein
MCAPCNYQIKVHEKNSTIFLALVILLTSLCEAQGFSENIIRHSKHDYYVMEGEYLIHYSIKVLVAVKADTVFQDKSLNNGKVVTTKAELLSKKGRKTFLVEGECVDANGKIKNCTTLRRKLDDKQQEITLR